MSFFLESDFFLRLSESSRSPTIVADMTCVMAEEVGKALVDMLGFRLSRSVRRVGLSCDFLDVRPNFFFNRSFLAVEEEAADDGAGSFFSGEVVGGVKAVEAWMNAATASAGSTAAGPDSGDMLRANAACSEPSADTGEVGAGSVGATASVAGVGVEGCSAAAAVDDGAGPASIAGVVAAAVSATTVTATASGGACSCSVPATTTATGATASVAGSAGGCSTVGTTATSVGAGTGTGACASGVVGAAAAAGGSLAATVAVAVAVVAVVALDVEVPESRLGAEEKPTDLVGDAVAAAGLVVKPPFFKGPPPRGMPIDLGREPSAFCT